MPVPANPYWQCCICFSGWYYINQYSTCPVCNTGRCSNCPRRRHQNQSGSEMARCGTCRGSGDATVRCSTCHGSKQTTDVDPNGNGTFIFPGTNVVARGTLIVKSCYYCKGEGTVRANCGSCNGSGKT
ncbi:hypothetical protein F5Y06DRAFT_266637 [Hypoxylon sp. FL0890]|nr:hypothetical protein F5Y06DRAFT_266637 [Hypoxylon sp. FL0890]